MADLIPMNPGDVPMHVELRSSRGADVRLPLLFAYSPDEHAYVAELPDGAGTVWFAAELTADLLVGCCPCLPGAPAHQHGVGGYAP